MNESEAERNFHDSQIESWAFEDEIIQIRKELLENVEELLLRKRFNYIFGVQKNHREDIDILYKYAHFLTIYSVILNVILIGVIICSIIMN